MKFVKHGALVLQIRHSTRVFCKDWVICLTNQRSKEDNYPSLRGRYSV